MAYEPPFFMLHEPFLLGVGVVFNLLKSVANFENPSQPAEKSAAPSTHLLTVVLQEGPGFHLCP